MHTPWGCGSSGPDATPGSSPTSSVTLATQCAQVMPVTGKVVVVMVSPSCRAMSMGVGGSGPDEPRDGR